MIKKLFSLLFGSKTEKETILSEAIEETKKDLHAEIAKTLEEKANRIKETIKEEPAKEEAPVVKKRAPKKKVTAETEAASAPAEKPKAKRAPRKKAENGETVQKTKRAPRNLKPKSE